MSAIDGLNDSYNALRRELQVAPAAPIRAPRAPNPVNREERQHPGDKDNDYFRALRAEIEAAEKAEMKEQGFILMEHGLDRDPIGMAKHLDWLAAEALLSDKAEACFARQCLAEPLLLTGAVLTPLCLALSDKTRPPRVQETAVRLLSFALATRPALIDSTFPWLLPHAVCHPLLWERTAEALATRPAMANTATLREVMLLIDTALPVGSLESQRAFRLLDLVTAAAPSLRDHTALWLAERAINDNEAALRLLTLSQHEPPRFAAQVLRILNQPGPCCSFEAEARRTHLVETLHQRGHAAWHHHLHTAAAQAPVGQKFNVKV